MVYFLCIVSMLLCVVPTIHTATIKRSIMMHVLEEEINGVAFTHRIDTIDGHRKETWAINGQLVEEYEYFDRIIQEEAFELKKQRQEERQRIRNQQDFIMQEQHALLKKIVQLQVTDIEKYLNKLSDMRLRPYLMFSELTFACQDDLDAFAHNDLKAAQELLHSGNQSNLTDLQDIVQRLKPYPERISNLYQHTLQAARERSDDTRLLKDLLHLVSEAANNE